MSLHLFDPADAYFGLLTKYIRDGDESVFLIRIGLTIAGTTTTVCSIVGNNSGGDF